MDKQKIKTYTKCVAKFCQKNAKINIETFNLLLDKLNELITNYKNNNINEELLLKEFIKYYFTKINEFIEQNDTYNCIINNCNKKLVDMIKIITNYIDNYYSLVLLYIKPYFNNYDPKPKIDKIIKNLKVDTYTIKNIKEIQKNIMDLLLKAINSNKKKIIKYIKDNKEEFIKKITETSLELKNKLSAII